MLYAYRCPDCDKTAEEFRPVNQRNFGPRCEACGTVTRRDILAEQTNTPHKEYYHMIWSDSMSVGCHPDDQRAHKQRHPDVPLDHLGRPGLASLKKKREYLKKEGWVDLN